LATGAAFAAVGWGLGPHWAVAGSCVVAATLIALVAIEGDGLAPPASVAVVGTALGGALLIGAAVADRRWSHVVGVVVGLAVAGTAVAVIRRRRPRPVEPSPWAAAAVLLPAGAAFGWLGPVYAGAGLATTAVVLVAIALARPARQPKAGGPVRGVVGVALAAGVVVATVIAVALGAGVGT
jgi:hypothetical protein